VEQYDLIVVGGGPAGMMAAGRAGERGRRVLLLERGPELGRKLLLSGGGRCNLTNTAPLHSFLRAYGRAAGFMRAVLSRFDNEALRSWFDERSVATVAEPDGCVFPETQDTGSVLDALVDYMADGDVEVRRGCRVRKLVIERGRVCGVDAGRVYLGRAVLVATGGLSYPATGSTGDGYELARQAGHTIVPTYPALCGLEAAERWPVRLAGTALAPVRVCARDGRGRSIASAEGPVLCTHAGLSGPAVLNVSGAVAQALARGVDVKLELDLVPSMDAETLGRTLTDAARNSSQNSLRSVLTQWVPRRVAAVLAAEAGVDVLERATQCSRQDLRKLTQALKCTTVRIVRTQAMSEAMVTGGGVPLVEIDAERMESKLVRGLHFAGEVVDVHGPCGGFNLQAAFSTGRVVGEAV
jgi:predicted Rossmann fold flavoprotein